MCALRNRDTSQLRSDGLWSVPSFQSPGLCDSRMTPGGRHSAEARIVKPPRKPPLPPGSLHLPLTTTQAGADAPRGFLGSGVLLQRILGVVVRTVPCAQARFRVHVASKVAQRRGLETYPPRNCGLSGCWSGGQGLLSVTDSFARDLAMTAACAKTRDGDLGAAHRSPRTRGL